MSRRATSQTSISLFPFLAVLVCTMGALILLLLAMTQKMRLQALARNLPTLSLPAVSPPADPPGNPIALIAAPEPEAVEPPASPAVAVAAPDPREQEFEEERARRRAAWQAQLNDAEAARLRLQASLQRQSQELARLKAAIQGWQENQGKLQQQAQLSAAQRKKLLDSEAALRGKRAELELQVRETERTIELLKRKRATESSQYALVPYDGASGTTRRPIYIECTDVAIRILPEDVILTGEDFDYATLGANPLLDVTQALLDFWRARAAQGDEPEPYVLLVVRPSGTETYYAARALLSRLDCPFGYELVEEDWQLHTADPDPEAKLLTRRVLANSRAEKSGGLTSRSGRVLLPDELGGLRRTGQSVDRGGEPDGTAGPSEGGAPVSPQGGVADVENGGTGGAGTSPFPGQPGGAGGEAVAGSPGRHGGQPGDSRGTFVRGGGPRPNGGPQAGGSRPGGAASAGGPAPGSDHAATTAAPGSIAGSQSDKGRGAGREASESPANRRGSGPQYARLGGDGNEWVEEAPRGTSKGSTPAGPTTEATDPQGTRGDPLGSARKGPTPEELGTAEQGLPQGSAEGTVTGRFRQNLPPEDGNWRRDKPPGHEADQETPDSKPGARSRASGRKVPTGPSAPQPQIAFGGQADGDADGKPVKHWGYQNGKATIALQKTLEIHVLSDKLLVGPDDSTLAVGRGETRDELVHEALHAVEDSIQTWGRPPNNFHWMPRVRFIVYPGGNQHYERLHGALREWGVFSDVEFRIDPPRRGTMEKR